MNVSSQNTTCAVVLLHDRAVTAPSDEPRVGQRSERCMANPNAPQALRSTVSHSSRTIQEVNHDGTATKDIAKIPLDREDNAGDRDRRRWFDDLVAVHLDDLYRFAYWVCGDRAVAEDVVQETLIRAWRSVDRLKDHKAAKGWLLTIVRRENARHYGRTPQHYADVPTDELVAQRTEYDTSTDAFVLRRALDRLPTEYREPLLMQVVYGYSQKEIAEHLGISNAGAGTTRHARVSIGVLIIQDIAAVAFIAVTAGKLPSLWALGLILLIPLRHVLHKLLSLTGHGELLLLFGIVLAVGGADVFEMVELKGDLGALLVGMLLASHPKANELAKALLGFKELFLVGFFLTVGMTALPGWNELLVALFLLAFLPFKTACYFGLFALFKLRARTAWQTSLNLANYSEFGLIVGTIATGAGWLPPQWLAVFAITLSLSFAFSAPLAAKGDRFYAMWRSQIKRLERRERLAVDADICLPPMEVVVFGMGRVGTSIYDTLVADHPGRILGVDTDEAKVGDHEEAGRNVIVGDGTNADFWSRVPGLLSEVDWVILALPAHKANISAAERLREQHYRGRLAATMRYPEEAESLRDAGVEFAYDLHTDAGRGFVEELRQQR